MCRTLDFISNACLVPRSSTERSTAAFCGSFATVWTRIDSSDLRRVTSGRQCVRWETSTPTYLFVITAKTLWSSRFVLFLQGWPQYVHSRWPREVCLEGSLFLDVRRGRRRAAPP